MAIYNSDADAVTAVTAFLDQFSVSNTGDVRYVTGTDTFHVTWLHRSLQHKVWDFTVAGDDDVQLSDPNPSTTAAIGSIITLLDQTDAGYTHRYNIDATVATYLFGGSVSQKDASGFDEAWYALIMSGSAGGTVEAQVVQDGVQLVSHWGTGKNQTAAGVVNRILVKTVEAGNLIDGGRVVVKAHDFNFGYSIWETTLGLTEQSSVVAAGADSFNQTAIGTVGAYGITQTDGEQYVELDLDGTGLKPYIGEWSYAPEAGKSDLYEYVKYILSRGSGETLFGVSADVWTGRVFEVDVDAVSGAGLFVQNETLSWPTGTGNLVAMDDLDATAGATMWVHLQTGTAPAVGETITGASTAAVDVDGVGSAAMETSANWLGQFTGSWIAADGIGFTQAEVTNTDSFTDINGATVSPPNFVNVGGTITTVLAADDPHVFMTLRTGSAANYTQHTVNGALGAGAATVTVNGAIPATTPLTGWIGVLPTGEPNYVFYEYSSWSGSDFTLVSTTAENFTDLDDVMVAHFYQSATGGGTTKTVARTVTYGGTPIDVIGWVRQGDEAAPDRVVQFSGQIGAGGFTFNVNLEREV